MSEEIIRRRMANTGEDYATAAQYVASVNAILSADVKQDWVDEWLSDTPWSVDKAAIEWLRSRPEALRPLMIRFPPSCVVRPKTSLRVPAPGTVGVLQSWFESGLVGVAQHPDGLVRGQCNPDDLEVVGHWRGWTPARVREVLETPSEGQT